MATAFIADIHGNLPALEAVLEDIARQGITRIHNLGDSLYGPMWPEETARLLIERAIPGIMGNGDDILLSHPDKTPTTRFSRSCLSRTSLDWLKEQPLTRVTEEGATLFHASPSDFSTYLLETVADGRVVTRSQEELRHLVQGTDTPLLICGHSHVHRLVQCGSQLIINAGSVGLPAYADEEPCHSMETFSPHARYVVVEAGCASIRAVAYDHQASARRAARQGREDWASWLLTGRTHPGHTHRHSSCPESLPHPLP